MAATHSLHASPNLSKASFARRYGFSLVTGAFFLIALIGHWAFAWGAYARDARAHGEEPEVSGYLLEVGRDTLENWQSEFLQLVWQVAGLAFLLHVGSNQSRESEERTEEKLDAILRAVDRANADRIIADLDERFDRT